MRRADFVVPVRANDQEVLEIRLNDQIFEQGQRGSIKPLKVVEKYN